MRHWWLLGLLIRLGLDGVVVQTQTHDSEFAGVLIYERGIELDEREYIRLTREQAEVVSEEQIADFLEPETFPSEAPPLPDLMPNLFLYPDGFFLKSPTLPIYVFLRCPESQVSYFYSEIYRDKFAFCDEQHLVIYDAEIDEQISELDGDEVVRHMGLADIYSFEWSPTGRYLAYSPTLCGTLSQETCPLSASMLSMNGNTSTRP
jgi:hypothetical protein